MEPKIVQVVGCAYTYRVSRVVRDKLAKGREDHSSHAGEKAFSYFKKIEKPEDIRREFGTLLLRRHVSASVLDHWYEPELALLLGPKHAIVAYGLGNDLTATSLEFDKPRLVAV